MIGDVVWTTPGQSSRDSLPLGNGDIAANVWTEPDGAIVFYLAKNDAWDHLGRLIKIGRLRLMLKPGLLLGGKFQQQLSLEHAAITVTNGATTVKLWCDAHAPRFVIEVTSEEPCEIHAQLDPWRTSARLLTGRETGSATGLEGGPVPLATTPDHLVPALHGAVAWYQRNTSSIWSTVLDLQGLSDAKAGASDPLLGRTFGGYLQGEGFKNAGPNALLSTHQTTSAVLTVTMLCAQTESADAWFEKIQAQAEASAATPIAKTWQDHCAWWQNFWARSHIRLESRAPDWGHAATISQQSAWHRFMTACCGRGHYPIKFNGGLLTADWGCPEESFDADYRRWGGGYWWQNTRLIYWAMLANGDYESTRPLFRMYCAMLPLAEQRTQKWFGHGGAFFPETLYFWGANLPGNYGWKREGKAPSDVENQYIRRYWQGGLELIALMLETYDHTRDQTLLETELLPITRAVLQFYALHYPDDPAGKLRFSPAQSLETWWEVENPMPEIAGLHHLLPRLLALPAASLHPGDLDTWRALSARLPHLPVGERNGRRILLAAAQHEDVPHNSENPELYAVFPYRLFGIGRPELDTAEWTFAHRLFPDTGCWRQDAVQAALLGLTETAAYYVSKNFVDAVTPARFKGFWGPNYDWLPDFDHGSVAQLALQTMLVQTVGERIYLFPAWPERRWNVSFRLNLPARTIIECELKDGEIVRLVVTPFARRKDVVILLGQDKQAAATIPAGLPLNS